MKKLILLLSFVFALGLFSVNAQDAPKKVVKKTPAKTEKVAKPAAKPAKKAPAKAVKPAKKAPKKVAATAPAK